MSEVVRKGAVFLFEIFAESMGEMCHNLQGFLLGLEDLSAEGAWKVGVSYFTHWLEFHGEEMGCISKAGRIVGRLGP